MLQHPMMLPYRNHLIPAVANVPEDAVPEDCGTERLLCLRDVSVERWVIVCLRAAVQQDW